MNVLYVSTYNDDHFFEYIFESAKEKPIQSIQKFNKLLVTGLEKSEDVDSISVLTSANVNSKISKKIFWKGKNVRINKTKFLYLPFINIKVIKQICMFFSSIIYLLYWCVVNHRKDSVLISDGFYPIVSTLSNIFCKLFSIPVLTFYTDLVKIDANDKIVKKTLWRKTITKIMHLGDSISICMTDMFLFLTEDMNKVINKRNKPYIVMEGLVDSELKKSTSKDRKKAIMYAGGLYEKYGVKMLIDAFNKWNQKDYELWLCGNGDLINYIQTLNNKNICYFGSIPNEEVVEKEQECMLLVNPRFSNEEYTKYSFPSKNMEYMLSGTPLLTTKLPGMPKEYHKYVYLIEEETVNGLINNFDNIFKQKDFLQKGKDAQKFVEEHKNNKIQANKILNFINQHTNYEKGVNFVQHFKLFKDKTNTNIVFSFLLFIKQELINFLNPDNEGKTNIHRLIFIYATVNIILLVLSMCNILGLFSVSLKTYIIYITSVVVTIWAMKPKRNTAKIEIGEITNEQKKHNNKVLDSNFFVIILLCSLIYNVYFFGRYLYIIKDLPQDLIRIVAFSQEFYGSAYGALLFLYVVTNLTLVFQFLLGISLLDKSINNRHKRRNIILMILTILIYSFIGFARMTYLQIIMIIFFSIIYFGDKKWFNWKKILKTFGIILFIFILSSLMLYLRLDKMNSLLDSVIEQFKQIFTYFLGPFRTLDSFVQSIDTSSVLTYGRATLAGIDEIILYPIKFLGSDVLSFNQLSAPYTQVGIEIGSTVPWFNNFFTSIFNFYLDFRFLGVIVFSYIHGFMIRKVFMHYNKKPTITSKMLILFVSLNLILSILKWQYQAGQIVFLLIVLIIIEKLGEYFKKVRSLQ